MRSFEVFMKDKFLLFILILFLFKSDFSFSQDGAKNVSKVGTTAGTFLEIGVGPSSGMGGAFVSLANDATALYWNSAGIANLVQNEVSVVHINWLASTNLDYAALVIPLGGIGNIGFSFTSLSMGDEKVRTIEMPEGTGEYYSASDIAVGVSYARNLTKRFSIGFTAKYIQESIWHMSSNAFAIDVGTLFKTDLIGGLTIGASISNFGTKMKLSGRDTRTFESVDPTKQGSNDRIPYVIDLDSWDLPLIFRIGLSTNAIKTDNYRLTVSVDALHPNDNYESVNTGAEFSFKEFLFIRGGYQSLFLADHEGGLTLGVGLNSKMLFSQDLFRFDYSYRDFGRLNAVHSFSVGIKF
jgi:hypothetical protein